MDRLKTNIFLLFVLLTECNYGQLYTDIVQYGTKSSIEEKMYQFNFDTISPIVKDKITKQILALSNEEDLVFIYLGIEGKSALEIDKMLKSPSPHMQEFLSNLYFADLDNDSDIDAVYDGRNPHYEIQLIRIFLNEGNAFKSISIPGYFISDICYSNNTLSYLKTIEIGCCDFLYDIYRKINFENKDISKPIIDYCTAIPKKIGVQEFLYAKNFTVIRNTTPLRMSIDQNISDVKIYLNKTQEGTLLNEQSLNDDKFYLVNVNCDSVLNGIHLSNVFGWIKEDGIKMTDK